MDVPVAARAGRPAWVNPRTLLGVLLFSIAFLAGQRVLEGARQTDPVWVASKDLAEGIKLQSGDVELVEVRLPADLLDRYAHASEDLNGATLTRAVRAGELIPTGWLAPSNKQSALSLTIPVPPEHAVGGALRPGDRVNVFATFDSADVRARTTLVARDVEVLDVVTAGGVVTGGESFTGVTVAVSPAQAGTVALAIRAAEIDIARIDGATTPAPPRTVRVESFQ